MSVFALIRGNDDGWSSPLIVGLLVAAVVLLAIFVVAEFKQTDPMLDLHLFKRPAMTGVSLAAFAISASIFAMFLYLTLFIQDDLGYGALASGVRFLPLTALAFIVAPVAGKLTVRVQARYMLGGGLLLIAAGLFTMGFTHANSTWTVLLPGFILAGVGIGAVNPVLASSAISVVPPERSGMASGANSTFRQVGIATGIAGLGSVFQSQLEKKTVQALQVSHTGTAIAARGAGQLRAAVLGGDVRHLAATLPGPARTVLLNAYRAGFSSSLNTIVLIAGIIALVGSIGAFALVRQQDFVPSVGSHSS
jgi:predicted MFS family arabinose efflux permease